MNQGTETDGRVAAAEVITTTQLGCCLIDGGEIAGRVLQPEPARGRRLLEFAARQGDIGAMLELGTRLVVGRGVARDPAEAKAWLSQACRRGSAEARVTLARLHRGRRRSRVSR